MTSRTMLKITFIELDVLAVLMPLELLSPSLLMIMPSRPDLFLRSSRRPSKRSTHSSSNYPSDLDLVVGMVVAVEALTDLAMAAEVVGEDSAVAEEELVVPEEDLVVPLEPPKVALVEVDS